MTTKELTALEELIGNEQVLVKKFNTLASQCTEAAIRTRLEDISQKHQRHYDTLMGYLQ